MSIDSLIQDIKERIGKQREEGFLYRDSFYPEERYEMLKSFLFRTYGDKKLVQLLRDKIECEEREGVYVLRHHEDVNIKRPSPQASKERILGCLRLLEGIREVTEEKLKAMGYRRIRDLILHPRFSVLARRLNEIIEEKRLDELISLCDLRLYKTDPIYLHFTSFYEEEDLLFLDIETLGLFSGNLLFLAGVGQLKQGGFNITQYLACGPEGEALILEQLIQALDNCKVIVTFNGKAFDLPFIEHRAFFNNLFFERPILHIDLFHFSRRHLKGCVQGFGLANIESCIFNVKRFLDLPSEYIPLLYKEYLGSGIESLLLPIVLHNRNDILALLRLLNFFYQRLCK